MLLAPYGAWAQQADMQNTPELPPVVPESPLAPLLTGGTGGYGASEQFSPFPKNVALQRPSQLPTLTPANEGARPFTLQLGVEGNEQMTDNVFETAKPTKTDFVTSADTFADMNVDSRHIKGGLKYDLGYDVYASNSQMDGLRQNGMGLFDVELIDQKLFLDARASVSEQTIKSSGVLTPNSRTAANNLVRVYTGSITPRFQQRLSDWALAQVSYHHDETRYENASVTAPISSSTLQGTSLNSSKTDGGRLDIRNGEIFSRLLWDYTGDINHVDFGASTFNQVTQTVGSEYRLTSDFGLLGSAGNDYLHSTSVDLKQYNGGFYSVGVHWNPSPDTDMRLGGGQRYGKTDWIVLFTHWLGSSTVLRLSVDEGITTDDLSFDQALNAVQRDENGSFINPFSGLAASPSSPFYTLSNAIYWQRNSDLVLRHDGARDSVALTARLAKQQLIGNLAPSTSPGINGTIANVMGMDFTWAHHLSPVLSLISQTDGFKVDSDIEKSKMYKETLSLNYLMNPSLTAIFHASTAASFPATSQSVRENTIGAGLRKTF